MINMGLEIFHFQYKHFLEIFKNYFKKLLEKIFLYIIPNFDDII